MREILFRGKSANTGEWIIGDYEHFYLSDGELVAYISEWGKRNDKVLPKTVGQCISGLTDKNGKKMFEGDIVKNEYSKGQYQYFKVIYNNRICCWEVENEYGTLGFLYHVIGSMEVIGNIHDNPELLKGGEG